MKIRPILGLCLMTSAMGVGGCGGSSAFSNLTDTDAATVSSDPDSGTTGMEGGADEAVTPLQGCRTSLDCPANKVCDSPSSTCVDCVADRDCESGKKCVDHLCATPVAPCMSSLDCKASTTGKVCEVTSGKCVACVGPADCPANNDCVGNVCKPFTPCTNSLACPKGQVCGTDLGRCVECVGSNDCSPDQTCAGNVCRPKCTSDTQCTKQGLLCDIAKGYCVSCVGSVDCKPEEFCANGSCAPDVCKAGSSTCNANAVLTCRSDGSGFGAPAACGGTQTCVAASGMASCKDRVCTPAVAACDTQSEKIVVCSTDGLTFSTKVDCSLMSQVCVAAACVPVVCEAGKVYCQGGVVRKCSPKGDSTSVVETCTPTQYCDAASAMCKAQLCTPNQPACNGKIATTCNSDGSGYVVGGVDCSPQTCSGGICVTCDSATEVSYNGHCYYLDGNGGVCDAGYVKASQTVLANIASSFNGKTYKHKVSTNCCVDGADAYENWGMSNATCNKLVTFGAGDPSLGGSYCNMSMQHYVGGQLTLCVSQ